MSYKNAEAKTDGFLMRVVKSRWTVAILAAAAGACVAVGYFLG